jgi:hypothetical protein
MILTFPESDNDVRGGERGDDDDAPYATPPTVHPVSDSEDDDMYDEDYREILSPEQPLPLPFKFQELSEPKHMPSPVSLPIANFLLHRHHHYTHGDRIQQIWAACD